MSLEKLNIVSSRIILALSLIALLTVLSGYLQPRHPAPTDEGTGAHIFQIAIVLVVLMGLPFLFTADWKSPMRSARRLVFPAISLSAL